MKISRYISMLAGAALLGSCLDTAPLGDTITEAQKKQTIEDQPKRLAAGVSGALANFYAYKQTVKTHADFGYPSIMLILESRGVDMVSEDIGYNWFSAPLTYSDVNYTNNSNKIIWQTLYNQIRSANDVTAKVDATTTNKQYQFNLAQAYTVRAFDYFKLVQIYQQTYGSIDPDKKLGVPLITEKNQNTAKEEGCARATVKATYQQILDDLNNAVTLFNSSGIERDDKRYANEYVARAIRAQVYLTMKNYSAALTDAEYVINNSGATPYSQNDAAKPTFVSINDDSWLWGIKTAETDDVVQSQIVNFPSHMGSLCFGYASVGSWRRVNKKLYNSIPSTDVRKGWFLDADTLSSNLSAAQQSYVIAEVGAPPYAQVKFNAYKGVLGQSINASDIPLIRIEEMYYIKAEAEAMGGNPTAGAATLTSFVTTYRNPSYTFTGTTAAQVQEEVFQQKRMEFWGEGIIWFDYMRLGKAFDRRGGGFEAASCYNIPAGDNALIYPLPLDEVQYNKKIGNANNNPTASKPTAVADI